MYTYNKQTRKHTHAIYTHIHTYTQTCIHTYLHTAPRTSKGNLESQNHTHPYLHTYIQTCIHTYLHTAPRTSKGNLESQNRRISMDSNAGKNDSNMQKKRKQHDCESVHNKYRETGADKTGDRNRDPGVCGSKHGWFLYKSPSWRAHLSHTLTNSQAGPPKPLRIFRAKG